MSPHIGYRIVPLLSATVPRYPHVVHRPDADLYFMLVKPWNWHSKIEDTRCSTCLLRSPVYNYSIRTAENHTHPKNFTHIGVHRTLHSFLRGIICVQALKLFLLVSAAVLCIWYTFMRKYFYHGHTCACYHPNLNPTNPMIWVIGDSW